LGHEAVLVPLYAPIKTDEENVSQDRVFFSGISLYLQQKSAFFRKLPPVVDKLWDSGWALRMATLRSVSTHPGALGDRTVATLRGERGHHRKEIEKLIRWLRTERQFDVIGLPHTLLIGLAEPLKRALGAPVVCTLQGEDLFLSGLVEPYQSECMSLIRDHARHVDSFIAVSAYYAAFAPDYLGIARDRIEIVPLGIDLDGHAPVEKPADGPLRIGYFARERPSSTMRGGGSDE
jgi:glycosyltransferase involved in cell wall biosynthesis